MIDRDTLIEATTDVMVREGGRLAEFHGWRCSYPDRYGECNCNQAAAAEIIDAVLPLIADAIETLTKFPPSGPFGEALGIERAANLVRTLTQLANPEEPSCVL